MCPATATPVLSPMCRVKRLRHDAESIGVSNIIEIVSLRATFIALGAGATVTDGVTVVLPGSVEFEQAATTPTASNVTIVSRRAFMGQFAPFGSGFQTDRASSERRTRTVSLWIQRER